jgi:cell division protein FtsZ
MNISLDLPEVTELKPRISVIGIGGAGCNAINNMIATGLEGVEFIAANTDAQALAASSAEHRIQLGAKLTEGLGAGARPEVGRDAAEEAAEDIRAQIEGSHMVFLAAGMGGGTGTGAISVMARVAREMGILTVAIVSKPFQFEGSRRMRTAEAGIAELRKYVDTLIVIPNQNLFRLANEKTTFAEAFVLADQVLYSGIACIVDLIVKDGLINLDFADVKAIMQGMGSAMMGTGEAAGDNRATLAAEQAISNPLLDDISLRGAKGLLISIIGGPNLTLFEVDEAASRVKQEADPEANIIVGASFEDDMDERLRVSIVASGLVGEPATGTGSYGSSSLGSNSFGGGATGSGAYGSGTFRSGSSQPASQPSTPQPAYEGLSSNPSSADQETDETGAASGSLDGATEDASKLETSAEEQDQAATADDSTGLGYGTGHPDSPPRRDGQTAAGDRHEREAQQERDPYLGDTSMDEFARALSEVIGTVDENDGAANSTAGGGPQPWRSADGVTIEEGFDSSTMPHAPPPLPTAPSEQMDRQSQSGFTPAPPAELPQRVPDIAEFPEIVQREYEARTAADEGHRPRQMGGMPNILRRLAGIGRQGGQLNDASHLESEHSPSSAGPQHSGADYSKDGEKRLMDRRGR